MRRARFVLLAMATTVVAVAALPAAAPAHSRDSGNGKLVFATGGDGASDKLEIASVNSDGSAFRKLTRVPASGIAPRWSTDGRSIVFLTHDTFTDEEANWRMDADGRQRRRLPGGTWDVPSPSGKLVEIYDRIVDMSGKVVRRVRPGLHREDFYGARPIWSPNGRFIAISVVKVNRHGDPGGYWVDVVPTTGEGRGIAATRRRWGRFAGALSWSPDSRRLLIEAAQGRKWNWYTIAPDGSDRRLVLRSTNDLPDSEAWSPDSSKIAYVGARGGISVFPSSGGRVVRLVSTRYGRADASRIHLAWSSRNEIAFSDKNGTYLVRPNGTGARRITTMRGVPAWSPKGNEVVLSAANEIYAIDRRGHERQLTRWVSDGEPQLSPDGEHVAFIRGHGVYLATPSVYVMNADGSGQRRIGAGDAPRWSPDSSRIAYVEYRAAPSNDEIFVADPNGGSPQAVTGGDTPTWSPDRQLAFMRYDYVHEDRGEPGGARAVRHRLQVVYRARRRQRRTDDRRFRRQRKRNSLPARLVARRSNDLACVRVGLRERRPPCRCRKREPAGVRRRGGTAAALVA